MTTQTSGRDPVEKLAEEFAERYRRGERPALTEYTQKYPELAEQIRDLFPAMVVIEQFGSVAEPPADPFSQTGGSSQQPQQLGEYCILREVGRGGMGVVYEAVQESLGRHVALKVLPFHGLLNPIHSERFRREARAAAQLHHTNIVPVFGIGEHQGIHYYAMQFIQGQGLDVILKEVRRLRDRKDFPGAGTGGPAQEVTVTIAQGLLQGQFRPGPPSGAAPNDAAGAVRRPPDSQSPAEAGAPGAALSETALHLPEQAQRQYFPQRRSRGRAGRRSPGLCPQTRDSAPRHQAFQPLAGYARRHLDHRFRPGQVRRQ